MCVQCSNVRLENIDCIQMINLRKDVIEKNFKLTIIYKIRRLVQSSAVTKNDEGHGGQMG